MHARRIIVLAVLAAGLGLFVNHAQAYCLHKFPGATTWAVWPAQPIKYRVSSNLTDPKILAAIDAAVASWDAVACSSLSFKKEAAFPISQPLDQGVGYINIYWVTKQSELPPKMGSNLYAYYFRGSDAKGAFASGAAAFNAATYKWNTTGGAVDAFDVQNVVTHYVGLLIGLALSKVPQTVMAHDVNFNQTYKRNLTQDDIAGLSVLYPGTCPAPPPPGADGCSGTTPPPVGDLGVKKDTAPPPPGQEAGPPPPVVDLGPVVPGLESGTPPPPPGDGPAAADAAGPGTGCTSNAQCGEGEICSIERVCVKTGGDDGCGCQVTRPGSLPLLALLALAGLLVRRRRRSR